MLRTETRAHIRETGSDSLAFWRLHFLDDDALGVGRTTEWVGLEGGAKVNLVVLLVGPLLGAATVLEVASSADTTWFTHLKA